jgi:Zn-dependent protease with chaperone function
MLRRLLPLLFSCLLIVLPSAEVLAAPVQQQTAEAYQGIVNSTANIRSGPGLTYSVVAQAQAGQAIILVACNEDCSWLQLDTGNWIAAFLVDLVSTTGTASSGSTRSRALDPDDLELTEPSPAALEIVAQILSYTGLPQTFDVFSANIYNAAALMANGKRVILYDPQLIADIENITDHDWPAVSILAHEIGHHLAGHTLAEAYNREFELEADYFSGYILYKMGATLDESQAVMTLLRDHPNMTDHPPQSERLAAIENGWQEAARQEGLAAWEPSFSNFEEEAEQNSEASYTPTGDTDLWSVLQQAHNQYIVSQNAAAVYAVKE